jgi:hypothetical protein
VEGRLEFGAVVCLDDLHREGQPLEHVVDELDRGFLVAARVVRSTRSRVQSSIAVNW